MNIMLAIALSNDDCLRTLRVFQVLDQRAHQATGLAVGSLHEIVHVIDDDETVAGANGIEEGVELFEPGLARVSEEPVHVKDEKGFAHQLAGQATLCSVANQGFDESRLSDTLRTTEPCIADPG